MQEIPPIPPIYRRIVPFLQRLRDAWPLVFRSPIDWHNMRACWYQSDPHYLERWGGLSDLTDEEFDEFRKALGTLDD